jgi:hypothetical protein
MASTSISAVKSNTRFIGYIILPAEAPRSRRSREIVAAICRMGFAMPMKVRVALSMRAAIMSWIPHDDGHHSRDSIEKERIAYRGKNCALSRSVLGGNAYYEDCVN